MPEKPQETGEQIERRWLRVHHDLYEGAEYEYNGFATAHKDCATELATFLEGLRELSAEWPHDFTKLSGPHDGAEKAKCKRCQIEKRLGERVTGGEKCAGSKEAR